MNIVNEEEEEEEKDFVVSLITSLEIPAQKRMEWSRTPNPKPESLFPILGPKPFLPTIGT